MTEGKTHQTDVVPHGVDLIDWDDFPKQRKMIFDGVKDSFGKQFPQSFNGVRLEVHDLDYKDPENYSMEDQKKALMENKFLHRRLRGTYRLYDEKTGDLLDQREATMMRVPYLTDRGTFIHNGSEYVTFRQARLLPGAYTRRKTNGELETHFNAKRGTGHSFRVRLEPETGLFKIDIGQSNLRLYSLLKDLGVPDDDLEKRWGKDLLETNKRSYDARVFEKAYNRLVRNPVPDLPREHKAKAISDALSATKLDHDVMQRTLPNLYNQKIATSWQNQTLPLPAPAAQAPQPKTDFDKSDFILLADFLNERYQAGIPLDAPSEELVSMIMGELHKLMPHVNSDLLQQGVGQNKEAQAKRGCLMAYLTPADAAPIVSWIEENFDADDLDPEKGIEHESHATIRYGFDEKLDLDDLKAWAKKQSPIRFTLGKVIRFKGVYGGVADCLVVEVDSADLVAANKSINKEFDSVLDPENRAYQPHLSLAYVKPGTATDIDGHANFEHATYVIKQLVYSMVGSKEKVIIPLGDPGKD